MNYTLHKTNKGLILTSSEKYTGERVETPDYILAVSDEKVREDDLALIPGYVGIVVVGKIDDMRYSKPHRRWKGLTCDTCFDVDEIYKFQKIIGYQPKGNAPELDLPLLPDVAVEDNVEKLAERYVQGKFNVNPDTIFAFERLHIQTFIAGHKAAAKVYSEEDLRKAIEMAREESGLSDNTMCYDYDEDEIIQSLKQPKTPKWFVAEKDNYMHEGELKTETNSEGKQVLKGYYL